MASPKIHLLIQPIIRYVHQLVVRADNSPRQLPSEMALCARFGVARGTVRRALDNLIERGIVQRLPKRRGYFSNPRHSHAGSLNIGILVGDGALTGMSSHTACMFAGFEQKFHSVYCSYYFLQLPSNSLEDLQKLLSDFAISGLLWLAPDDENLPAIRQLLDNHVAMVAIEDVYHPNSLPLPEHNFLCYDKAGAGEIRAENFLAEHCRLPLYCASRSPVSDRFFQIMRRHGIPADDNRLLGGLEHLQTDLTAMLDTGQVDGIICNGDRSRYKIVMDTLDTHPHGREVKLFLEKEPCSIGMVPQYPRVQTIFLHPLDMHRSLRQAGYRAGTRMHKLLFQHQTTFNTEVFS